MVMNDLNDVVRSLRQCNDCLNVVKLQMNELLDDIDDYLNNPGDHYDECGEFVYNEYGCSCDLDDDNDYCDECGELYPDDCVCEEEDYMDDDFDEVKTFKLNVPKMNAFARAKWFKGY